MDIQQVTLMYEYGNDASRGRVNEEMDRWCENRSGCVYDRVKECNEQR